MANTNKLQKLSKFINGKTRDTTDQSGIEQTK